jgi:hydrogenase-4 component F
MLLLMLILAPFAGGVVSAIVRSRRAMETANVVSFGLTFTVAVTLAAQVLDAGTVSLWGAFLHADALSALVCLLTASVAFVCSIYAVGYLREDERNGLFDDDNSSVSHLRRYYSLTPLFVSAMMLVALANNLGVMWVAIEATTLTSVFLVTFYGKNTSLEAAWKYAIIGGVGLSMALFATVLVYYAAHKLPGSDTLAGLNWSVLAGHAAQLDKTTMRLAFILALLGYGTKAGLAPMHTWKPDAYSEAPVPSAALLSTAMLNCAIYGLVRFYILTSRSLGAEFPGGLLLLLGLVSMGIAVPFILLQKNIRRLLAYSSIDQAGIMVVALGIGNQVAVLALMLHMTYHTIAKSLLFLCAGAVCQQYKTDLFDKVKGGVIRAIPVAGVTFLLASFAVTGMPPFCLFQSEFLIVQAAFFSEHYFATALFVLFGTGIFAGALLHIGGLVLGQAEQETVSVPRPWRNLTMLVLAAILLIAGFWLPAPLLELIRGAARVVTGG